MENVLIKLDPATNIHAHCDLLLSLARAINLLFFSLCISIWALSKQRLKYACWL